MAERRTWASDRAAAFRCLLRLEAEFPGRIGIARAFAYGGAKGRAIYDPAVQPTEHRTAEAYLKSGGHTINHFYEKLLLLKDRMNTATGRAVAETRHAVMEDYLRRFYEEWEGDA